MIREFASERRKVLWFGVRPDRAATTEFSNRGLIIETCPNATTGPDLRLSRALVLFYNRQDADGFRSLLRRLGAHAVDHGHVVMVIAESDEDFLAMDAILKEERMAHLVTKRAGLIAHEIAEFMARHDAGPSECDVEITGERVAEQTRLLLCRAFRDCKRIRTQSMAEGRSADVFSVYAVFRGSNVGPRPLPFFAKVDKVAKIQREMKNYEEIVDHFVPFQARPGLDARRCCFGSTHGILVGKFVEHSESFLNVAQRGAAQPVIYSLFDEALRGWKLQAYSEEAVRSIGDSLWKSLTELFDLTTCLTGLERRAKEATRFGEVWQPKELLDVLRKTGVIQHRLGPCHADLHVGNIRARRGEAILIDFHSARVSGPLIADPASLEVSLVFEVAADEVDDEGWRSMAEALYKAEFLHRAPPPPQEPAPREWMWACVRQVRLIALESQETDREYHYALIWYLLRRASFHDESKADAYRRDYAYYLACRLTQDLERTSVA